MHSSFPDLECAPEKKQTWLHHYLAETVRVTL